MKTILIAETSPIIADALAEALQNRYNIHTCTNGHAALECLEQLRPDALIINLALPDIDSLTILEHATYTPSVIVALTNFVSSKVVQHSATLGVSYIFPIPCSIKAVVARLEEMIGLFPI